MNYFVSFLVFLSSFSYLFSSNYCNIEIQDTLNFETIDLRSQTTKNISIKNLGDKVITINQIKINSFYDDYIYFDNQNLPLNINPNEDYNFNITFIAKQNINYRAMIFFQIECDENKFSIPIYIKADISVENLNQDAKITDNKWGADLVNAISSYLQNHNAYSYKDARKLFWASFDRRDNLVECIYTGKTIDPGDDPDFSDLDKKGFNTEHTWPKSLGAEGLPMESDINHLFVTDKTTNDKRANYPFGTVVSNVSYENGGSKLGKNEEGKIVFEPRDISKGNIARAIFYFAVRYNNPNNFLDTQENALRQWLISDPVDELELARNDSVIKYQKKSNLFIEFPELFVRVPSISQKSYPEYKVNYFASDSIIIINSTNDYNAKFWISNFSNLSNGTEKELEIEKMELAKNQFFTVNYDKNNMQIPFNSTKEFDIILNEKNINIDDNLKIIYKDGTEQNIIIKAVNPALSVNNYIENNLLITNYPNPATNKTTIDIKGLKSVQNIKTIKVYDMHYGFVSDLTNSVINQGDNIQVDLISNNNISKNLIYFVRIELTNQNIIHPIIFLN